MARVWIKGYTKSDGTKVKGHYRDESVRQQAYKTGSELVTYSNNKGDSYAKMARSLRRKGDRVYAETNRSGSFLYRLLGGK